MSRPADLFLELVMRRALKSEEEGRELLEAIERHVPEWYPRLYGHEEPVRNEFDPARLTDAWRGRSVLWKGENGEDGRMWMRVYPDQAHSTLTLDGFSDVTSARAASALLRDLAARFDADWGFLHRLDEADLERPAAPGSLHRSDDGAFLRFHSHELENFLPDLYWADVLGAPYASMFGRDRILSTPVAAVEEIGRGIFYLQLTDSPDEDAAAVRAAAKAHLGSGAFWDPERGEEHRYDAPRFAQALSA